MIKVLVVDDQALARHGIRAMLQTEEGIQVVGEATNGEDALQKTLMLVPDVVLMDIMMAEGDGINATRAIRQQCPTTQVLMITVYPDEVLFHKAIEAGAAGYVLKDISAGNLGKAIHAVHGGATMINPTLARKMVDHLFASHKIQGNGGSATRHGLTDRETEVLIGVAQGLSNKEIATKLYLAESTVKTHLQGIFFKLHLRNRAQAAAFAIEKGLLPIDTSRTNWRLPTR